MRTLHAETYTTQESAREIFLAKVCLLTEELTKDLVERIKSDGEGTSFELSRRFNRTLAFLLQDLFGCVNLVDAYRFVSVYLAAVGHLLLMPSFMRNSTKLYLKQPLGLEAIKKYPLKYFKCPTYAQEAHLIELCY